MARRRQKTILEATESFIRDAEARGLRPPSIYKYRLLFKQLNAFADEKGHDPSRSKSGRPRYYVFFFVSRGRTTIFSARKKLEALQDILSILLGSLGGLRRITALSGLLHQK